MPTLATKTLDSARQGDREAFGHLVDAYQGMVRGFIALRIFDTDAVYDLAQETFVQAFSSLTNFEGDDLGPWLCGIARNLIQKHLRGQTRRKRRERQHAAEWLFRQQQEKETDVDVEIAHRLETCLSRLRQHQHTAYKAIRLRYFDGLSTVQVAEAIQRKDSAVRVLLMRARETLRLCIESTTVAREG